jgi:hypothetical protein
VPAPYPGQQWKHGWIPLTGAAAKSKNHGRKPPSDGGNSKAISSAAASAAAVLKGMKPTGAKPSEKSDRKGAARKATSAKSSPKSPAKKTPKPPAAKPSWPKPPKSKPGDDSAGKPQRGSEGNRKAAATPTKAKPVPESAKPFHRELNDIADLADAVENGFPPKNNRPLGGGAVAMVELLTLRNGRQVVRKSTRLSNGGVQDAPGEQAASLVARALGLDAPRVYRNDEKSIYMDYIADAETGEDIRSRGDTDKFNKAMASDDGKRIGLLDVLTFNYDRNSGNWLLTPDGRVIPIDHGVAYTESLDIPRGQHLEYLNDFADHYKGPNPLTKADIAEVRRRLNSLRADFAHIGKLPWWKHSMQALEDLEDNASGTRNLIAGIR